MTEKPPPEKTNRASSLPPGVMEAAVKMMANARRRQEWPLHYGAILPSATFDHPGGMRLVSAGNQIFEIPMEQTWYGFLYNFLAEQIGSDWFADEIAKPKGSRHILADWYLEACRREADENGYFTGHDPENEIGTTLAFRSVAYDMFCMMQAMNLSPKLLARLRHPDQFEGARYELWVAASLARAGFAIEFSDEDNRASKHGEGIATHTATGKKYWIEAKRKHRPGFDYLRAAFEGWFIKVDAKLVAAAMLKPAEQDRLIFIDVNRPPWRKTDIDAPWISAFRKSLNLLEQQARYRDHSDQRAFVMVTNHPYHYVSNIRPDPRHHFFGAPFNMPELDPAAIEKDYPVIFALAQSISQHFSIPDTFLENP